MKHINENYFKNTNSGMAYDIKDIISEDEQILWQGKPKKKAYVWGQVLKLFPLALIWILFDGFMLYSVLKSGSLDFGVILFFAIHLLPVWIWIANIITASRRHKNLEYVFTNKRIIIKSGIIGIDFENIYYADINSVNLKVGLIDRMLKVGDIYISSFRSAKVLFDIDDPYFITQKLQSIVSDIKTDIEFPNALRPRENHGYSTKYKK